MHVGFHSLAKSSNFEFLTILYGRSPLSDESKNCLNILCNYTMTHYAILTIKQQIWILTIPRYGAVEMRSIPAVAPQHNPPSAVNFASLKKRQSFRKNVEKIDFSSFLVRNILLVW